MDGYSVADLLKFLDWMGEKGLANRNTISARKAATNNLLAVLDQEERRDVREVDIDATAERFNNLEGSRYSPESLQVYKSRTVRSIRDFLKYKENPANFKPTTPRLRRKSGQSPELSGKPMGIPNDTGESTAARESRRITTIDIPVPIRSDVIVQVNGVPTDLSATEAQKIANVIIAMATE